MNARRLTISPARLPAVWSRQHAQSLSSSLRRVVKAPLPMLMTIAVVGIALAFPAALYVLTTNLSALSANLEQTPALSVFLDHTLDDTEAEALAEKLRRSKNLAEVQVITKDQALEEFREMSGFGAALDQFPGNPLPAVLAIRPAPELSSVETLERLRQSLESLSGVDLVRLDTAWVRRFQALVELAREGVLLLATLLAIAVTLIIGNTIRLEIETRHAEIEIMGMVGATHGYIRRPFLYTGFWYGLFGGATAWLLVMSAVILLQQPVTRVATLYHTAFPLQGLGFQELLVLLAGGVLLGLIGSWIAVARHLVGMEPV